MPAQTARQRSRSEKPKAQRTARELVEQGEGLPLAGFRFLAFEADARYVELVDAMDLGDQAIVSQRLTGYLRQILVEKGIPVRPTPADEVKALQEAAEREPERPRACVPLDSIA